MDKNLEEIEFTIFDTETTGLDFGRGDRIVEIAGIRFKGKGKIATFHTLVNPQKPISAGAFQVNQISPEMLEAAPKMDAVLPGFLEFIQGSSWGFGVDYSMDQEGPVVDMEFKVNELVHCVLLILL